MYEDLRRSGGWELVRRINAHERRLDDLAMPEISPSLADPLLSLPALRGAWVGVVDADGDWWDLSPFDHDLGNVGNVNLNLDGVVPYWDLDGANDYFHISDAESANKFDILGTETFIAAAVRGLTIMGWFYLEETGTTEALISKWGAEGDYAYELGLDASDQFFMRFSDNGTNISTVSSSAVSMSAWYFAAGRVDFTASSVDVFVGSPIGLEESNNATALASINDTATDFNVGSQNNGTNDFQGLVACVAVCACACSDTILSSVFNRMRGAFGV